MPRVPENILGSVPANARNGTMEQQDIHAFSKNLPH